MIAVAKPRVARERTHSRCTRRHRVGATARTRAAAHTAIRRIERQVRLAPVGRRGVAIREAGAARREIAHTRRAQTHPVGRHAGRATRTAVHHAGRGGRFAAVRGVAITVAEPGLTRTQHARPSGAGSRRIREVASVAAGSAVEEFRTNIHFAPVGLVGITVAEARVASKFARARRARGRCVRSAHADVPARSAIRWIRRVRDAARAADHRTVHRAVAVPLTADRSAATRDSATAAVGGISRNIDAGTPAHLARVVRHTVAIIVDVVARQIGRVGPGAVAHGATTRQPDARPVGRRRAFCCGHAGARASSHGQADSGRALRVEQAGGAEWPRHSARVHGVADFTVHNAIEPRVVCTVRTAVGPRGAGTPGEHTDRYRKKRKPWKTSHLDFPSSLSSAPGRSACVLDCFDDPRRLRARGLPGSAPRWRPPRCPCWPPCPRDRCPSLVARVRKAFEGTAGCRCSSRRTHCCS